LATLAIISVALSWPPASPLSLFNGRPSLVVLAVAVLARYTFHLAGAWRWACVVGAAAL
jgi:hypothetical protein